MTNIVILVIGALLSISIFYLVRKDKMHGPFATWWLMVALATIILSAFPSWVDNVALKIGIVYPPTLILVLAVGLMLIKMLTMDMALTRKERKIRRLTQRMAIIENKIDMLTKDQPNTQQPSKDK